MCIRDRGKTTIKSGGLDVTGNTTLNNNLTVKGTAGITGATTLGNTLTVAGATTVNNTLHTTGNVDFDSNLNVDGNLTVGSNSTINIPFSNSGTGNESIVNSNAGLLTNVHIDNNGKLSYSATSLATSGSGNFLRTYNIDKQGHFTSTFGNFTNNSISNYVTYTSSTGVKTNNAKFISDINVDSTGKLTYNVARLTYATGAVGGVETKGLVSIDTTSTKGVSATTKLGLSINNGILKFTKIIDPIITLTGSTVLRPTTTSQIIKVDANNYTTSVPNVQYTITPSWGTTTTLYNNTFSAASDNDPSVSHTSPISWNAPTKTHNLSISWGTPVMGGSEKTIKISLVQPTVTGDDDTKITGTYTIYIRYPIFYSTSDITASSIQTASTVCGWSTGDGSIASTSEFTGGKNEAYVAIYSSSSTKLVKYLWGTTANTSASRLRTLQIFGVTYSIYKLNGSNANKLKITALS